MELKHFALVFALFLSLPLGRLVSANQESKAEGPRLSRVCASEEFLFVAAFPSEFAETRVDSALGPVGTFMGIDGESGVIYRIDAVKLTQLQKYADLSGEDLRSYLKRSFATYSKTEGNSNPKADWRDDFSWCILEYSITQDGMFQAGVRTEKSAFTFVKNKIHYTVSISTIPSVSTPSGMELDFFMATFIAATPEQVRDYQNSGRE